MNTLTPIPPEFYDEETDAPFERCGLCERSLLVPGAPDYILEKAVRQWSAFGGRDVIFAHAVCMPCYETTMGTFSEESLATCQKFMEERFDEEVLEEVVREAREDVTVCTSVCAFTGTPREELEEYQTLAHARGLYLVPATVPVLVSGAITDELLPLLSKATRDELGGLHTRLGTPPPTEHVPVPMLL